MFRKYASAEIIAHSGQHTGRTAGKRTLGSFDYEPRDDHKYLYVAVRACTADVPNLNYDMLPSSELKGKEAYRTFIGSYVYLNHDNTDPMKARGAIIDAKYHDENPDDQWVEILEELDEEKCPKLCSLIRSGEIDTVSMGCEVTSTTCSICGNEAEYPFEYCDHVVNKGQRFGGKLAYEICNGIDFFECSWVYNPADPTAYVQALDKTAKVAKKTSKNLNLGIADEDLEDAYYHFTNDLGYTPDVDDIIGQLIDWYGYDEPETDKEWGWLWGAVKEFLSRKKDVWLDQHGELTEDNDTALNPKYAVEKGMGKRSRKMKGKTAVQTTFVPHWDMDYATVEYTVYQCDDLENCRWVFFDYDFAMRHGFDFEKYDMIYHGHYDLRGPSNIPDMDDKQFLELLYMDWNTDRIPKDAWKMRSLSMSDIVYLYGKYYYCDTFGWKEIDPYKKGEASRTASLEWEYLDDGSQLVVFEVGGYAVIRPIPDEYSDTPDTWGVQWFDWGGEKLDEAPRCSGELGAKNVAIERAERIFGATWRNASKHADDDDNEKEDSFANADRKPDDISTKEKQDVCPLCDSPSFDGEYCNICGYQVPPDGFDDIKLEDDSDYEEYESDADYDDMDEVEEEDAREDEGMEKSASIMYDISDDPQTYIGIAEEYGDYSLIGFDILKTDDYDLQIELEEAGAIEL